MSEKKSADSRPEEDALLHHRHRSRVFARFFREGISGFEPHQALELLLFYAIPRKDTNLIAHRLLKKFGSLYGVLHADQTELCRVAGVGVRSAGLISLVRAINQAAEAQHSEMPVVGFSRSQCEAYLRPLMAGLDHEQVHVLYFNNRNRMIRHTIAAEGSHNHTTVNLRRVVEEAMECGAAGVILAHNHPSAESCCSPEDVTLTKNLYCALYYLNISICDHLIFAGDRVVSLAEQGIIREIERKLSPAAVQSSQFYPDTGNFRRD